jgi:ribonuclease E
LFGRNGGAHHEQPVAAFAAAEAGAEDAGEAEADDAAVEAAGADASGEARGEAERRRRRRGRRGGRRNRRGREDGDVAAAASEIGGAPEGEAQVEPELVRAVTDFDAKPPPVAAPVPEKIPVPEAASAPPEDVHRPVAPAQESAAEHPVSELPRRRSSVREPAPFTFAGEATVPAQASAPSEAQPQPVVRGPTEDAADDRPRRSGWWSRRALGKE